ncbi:MAG: hypothetical protein JSW60_09410, partial [Thermoplasmatales archaeon]
KIIVGCIIAVGILIGVSFTSVVGYSSVKSNSAINSPLFSVRTNRAIDEESKDLTCDYVGKGKMTNIQFSRKDGTTVQLTLNIIKVMDDKTFSIFMKFAIRELLKNNVINYREIPSIIKALKELREGDVYVIPKANELLQSAVAPCWTDRCVTVNCATAFAGCVRYKLLVITVTATYALFPNFMNFVTEYLNPEGPFKLSFLCATAGDCP